MEEKIKIFKSLVNNDVIEDLKVSCDYSKLESYVSFCFYYVEFLPDDDFFKIILPDAKRISIHGLDDETGRGVMTLVFDGVLNENVN